MVTWSILVLTPPTGSTVSLPSETATVTVLVVSGAAMVEW